MRQKGVIEAIMCLTLYYEDLCEKEKVRFATSMSNFIEKYGSTSKVLLDPQVSTLGKKAKIESILTNYINTNYNDLIKKFASNYRCRCFLTSIGINIEELKKTDK